MLVLNKELLKEILSSDLLYAFYALLSFVVVIFTIYANRTSPKRKREDRNITTQSLQPEVVNVSGISIPERDNIQQIPVLIWKPHEKQKLILVEVEMESSAKLIYCKKNNTSVTTVYSNLSKTNQLKAPENIDEQQKMSICSKYVDSFYSDNYSN